MSTNYPEPVAGDVHETIKRELLRSGFPQELVDEALDLEGGQHRLSHADIAARVEAMRRWSSDRVRAGLQQIVYEDELYRFGFDCGVEDGYLQAADEIAKHLEEMRPEPARPSGAPIEADR